MLQKQSQTPTPQKTGSLRVVYWIGYSLPLVAFGLAFWHYQTLFAESWGQALMVLLYSVAIPLCRFLGEAIVRLTGRSQAQRCVETWKRTPRALPEFPRQVVLASAQWRDSYYRRGFWIVLALTLGGLAYHYVKQPGDLLRGLGLFVFPGLVYLIYWWEKKPQPRELAHAGGEGVWVDKRVPWEEIARLETRLRRNYLGEPEWLRLDLFDVSDRALGQVWIDCEGPKCPEAPTLESFYTTLRAEFEVTGK